MAVFRERPYPGFNFLVDLGTGETDSARAGFEEVSFPEVLLEVVEYRNGNEKENSPRKLTTLERSTNLILKRGVIGSLDLYHWWNDVRNGNQSALRTITVNLMSEDHASVVMTWKFLRARPVKLRFSKLQAQTKDLLVEFLEIAFERMEME
jgi:phage tail-like protein